MSSENIKLKNIVEQILLKILFSKSKGSLNCCRLSSIMYDAKALFTQQSDISDHIFEDLFVRASLIIFSNKSNDIIHDMNIIYNKNKYNEWLLHDNRQLINFLTKKNTGHGGIFNSLKLLYDNICVP